MNLQDSDLSIIRSIPLHEIASAVDDLKSCGFCSAVNSGSMDLCPSKSEYRVNKPHQSACKKELEIMHAKQLLREGIDSLIIVSYYDPIVVLLEAIYLLCPSSPFVVHCEFLEPLVDCYLQLQGLNIAVRMVLSDTWMREYQTLPGRVHPQMNMSTSGGFILSGIYVGMVPSSALSTTTSACATITTTTDTTNVSRSAHDASGIAEDAGGSEEVVAGEGNIRAESEEIGMPLKKRMLHKTT